MKKTILITGASRGIGAAIARRLAVFDGSPSRLILNCNTDTEGLATVIDEINRAVPDCQIVPMICDLSDAEARSAAFARCRRCLSVPMGTPASFAVSSIV